MEYTVNQKNIENAKNLEKNKREALLVKAFSLVEQGVMIHDPYRIDIRGTLICGENVEIDINVIIEGVVKIGNGVKIGANCILRDCKISNDTEINPYSLIEKAVIGEHCFIGPYSRLRPNSFIGDESQIGNYVEIKNSNIASKCRINHHSFVGDADIEKGVTLGAGTITCNHDGSSINRMVIKEGAYIGSGTKLIAPLIINAKSYVAAGSTIIEDVPSGTLAIARSRQLIIKNWNGPKSKRNKVENL